MHVWCIEGSWLQNAHRETYQLCIGAYYAVVYHALKIWAMIMLSVSFDLLNIVLAWWFPGQTSIIVAHHINFPPRKVCPSIGSAQRNAYTCSMLVEVKPLSRYEIVPCTLLPDLLLHQSILQPAYACCRNMPTWAVGTQPTRHTTMLVSDLNQYFNVCCAGIPELCNHKRKQFRQVSVLSSSHYRLHSEHTCGKLSQHKWVGCIYSRFVWCTKPTPCSAS